MLCSSEGISPALDPTPAGGAALDASSGSFPAVYKNADSIINGEISTVVPDGSGGWYIGGSFSKVGSVERKNIARVRADGSPYDWNPNANGSVNAIIPMGNTIYIGGDFSQVDGQARDYIAAVEAGTGNVSAWNPDADELVIALAASGGTIYAGGGFTSIGGQSRTGIAALNASTGEAY